MEHKPPAPVIEAAHAEHLTTLPFDDTADFDDTDRGFIAALQPCVVTAADGRVVWDNDVYEFLAGDAPTSVHPSLWRQSTLAGICDCVDRRTRILDRCEGGRPAEDVG